MNYLIIVAGGKAERFNRDLQSDDRKSLILATKKVAQNKIFAKIGGRPLIYWTILAFEKSKSIDEIIISATVSDISKVKAICNKFNFSKVKDYVVSVKTRQESTFEVLKKIKDKAKKTDLVGVHNAANPFVTKSEIKQVFAEAGRFGAALLAQPARDTVKISNKSGFVLETPLRQFCWYAQTPQVATFANLWKAFSKAHRQRFIGTDDAQLLERAGIRPKIITCSNVNMKITFVEDLTVAGQILKTFAKNYE